MRFLLRFEHCLVDGLVINLLDDVVSSLSLDDLTHLVLFQPEGRPDEVFTLTDTCYIASAVEKVGFFYLQGARFGHLIEG